MHRLLPLVLLVACYGPDAPVPAELAAPPFDGVSDDLSTTALFDLAAETYGVPRDLLVAIAWHNSGLGGGTADPDHHSPAAGWMGLNEGQVLEAVGLTGYPAAAIRTDREASVLAGAALLAELRRTEAPAAGPSTLDERWFPAVSAFAGFEQGWLRDEVAVDVFRTLQMGAVTTTPDGMETLEIGARDLPGLADIELRQPPGGDSSDFSGAAEFPGARWVPAASGNQSTRSHGEDSIRRIVLHTTEGNYGGAISWFQNESSDVSAHFVVRRSDGEVTQMVKLGKKAWHACNNNNDTIGIEQEGYSGSSTQWTPQLLDSSARLTAWLVNRYDIPIDRQHIVGHGEIQPAGCATRTDPGSYFPWDSFMQKVQGYANGGSSAPEAPGETPVSPGPAPEVPSATISFESPHDGDEVGNPVLMRIRREGGPPAEVWCGAYRLARDLVASPVHVGYQFNYVGTRPVTAKALSASGALLASSTIQLTIRNTQGAVTPVATEQGGLTWRFRATAPGATSVKYWVDGRLLSDDNSGSPVTSGPDFALRYTFPHAGPGHVLQARSYRANGTLLAEGFAYFDVTGDATVPHITNMDAQESAGRLMRLTTEATVGVERIEYRSEGQLLTDLTSGLTFGEPDNFELWVEFGQSGARDLEATAYDGSGQVVDVQHRTIWVPDLDLSVTWTRSSTKQYHFDADAPPGTSRVIIEIDGWALPDQDTGLQYTVGPAFEMNYHFNYGGTRVLHAIAKDPVGNVVDETTLTIQVY